MRRSGPRGRWLAAAALALALGAPKTSPAEEPACRVVQVEFTPSDDLQIVVWIEDAEGNYVDTAFITRLTGSYGLGNRPGMMEFNSAFLWPYGRRTTTFPIWAGRHGMEWPLVVFQNGDEDNLSHPLAESSLESFYCRPVKETEPMWDTQSCATTVYTDKGVLDPNQRSKYPPRSDLDMVDGIDDPSVADMASMNPFDSVSRATPQGGKSYTVSWAIPDDLPNGDYVAYVEAGKEFDQNENYDYPEPEGIPWSDYGVAYRGQPSVVWRVPFTVGDAATANSVREYAGYGDPDGIDHELRAPDGTITTGVPGSGAGRLQLAVDDSDQMYRVRVSAFPANDEAAPGGAGQLEVSEEAPTEVTASFIAPGDDDQTGTVAGYEVRYLAGEELTDENFDQGTVADVQIEPLEAGTVHEFDVEGLLPRTNYYIGVRAYDECLNYGPVVATHALTPEPEPGEVDACFIATAAYGSILEDEVEALRTFRDVALRSHVVGELAVEGYYTFGPALAEVIERSDTLRRATRAALGPLVEAAAGAVR